VGNERRLFFNSSAWGGRATLGEPHRKLRLSPGLVCAKSRLDEEAGFDFRRAGRRYRIRKSTLMAKIFLERRDRSRVEKRIMDVVFFKWTSLSSMEVRFFQRGIPFFQWSVGFVEGASFF